MGFGEAVVLDRRIVAKEKVEARIRAAMGALREQGLVAFGAGLLLKVNGLTAIETAAHKSPKQSATKRYQCDDHDCI